MNKEQEKSCFLNNTSFTEDDWVFFNKYPRTFTIFRYIEHYDINLVDEWYNKFNCDIEQFELITYTLYMIIQASKSSEDIEIRNKYANLEKYEFKDFMDSIDKYRRMEKLPIRIHHYLELYLKN